MPVIETVSIIRIFHLGYALRTFEQMTSLSDLFLSSGPLPFDILKQLIALYLIYVVRSKLLALNYFPTYLWCRFIKLVATLPSLSGNRTLILLIATKKGLRGQSFFRANHPVSLHVIFVPEGPVCPST